LGYFILISNVGVWWEKKQFGMSRFYVGMGTIWLEVFYLNISHSN
jgi:hypothetical protein